MDNLLERIAGLSPAKREILELRMKQRAATAGLARTIPRRIARTPAAASFAQQRLWFLDQLEPGSPFYNISRAFRLQGPLNIGALSKALTEIVYRHESLRTSFGSEDGTPFQRIMECESLPLPLIEASPATETEKQAEVRALAAEEIKRPFDLSRSLLLRASLLRITRDDHVLVLTMQHIAGDGWSLAVLFHELSVLYDAFLN